MELLLEHKASPDIGDKQDGRTALHMTAKYERSEMLELLLKHKASTEPQNKVICTWAFVGEEIAWWLISWSCWS